ncbi:MAG: glycosyltransferase family 4 protein, partial [Candidatus Niyogibacteria bacterium]|nr:glycosyltransferase family 4 protein [Candidatus Niyogibacteria bacterium]
MPTEKAHGRAAIKLCEAFAKQGIEVELIIPRLLFRKQEDIFSYYDLQEKFTITYLPALDLSFLHFFERITYPARFISFSKCAALYCWKKYRKENNVVYFSHDTIPLYFLSFISKNIFYDIHDFPSPSFFARRVMQKAHGFSVQTKAKIPLLKKEFDIPAQKIVYWPNGTDVGQFAITFSKAEARKKLKLPQDQKIAMYAGQLFSWKGVETFIRASHYLRHIAFYVIGGSTKDRARLLKDVADARNKNVYFIDQQPHEEMPRWLKAADVAVLPNTGKEDIARLYTSPMKLFEYMASGVPIVASRLPSIEEIIDEETAFFAEPDDPKSFADAIQEVFSHPEISKQKGEEAQKKASQYTWDARAKEIILHMARVMSYK